MWSNQCSPGNHYICELLSREVNCGNAIALCKTRPYEMRGFKLAPGVGTDPGRSIYGYFGFYRDAKEAMEHAFDAHSNAKISKDVLVGPNDPFAKPPKVRP